MNKKGILYTVASAMLFGFTPLIAMMIYAFGADAITVVFYRSLIVIAILGFLLWIKKIPYAIEWSTLAKIAFVAFFGNGATTIFLFSSYQFIDTGTATSLHFLYPIFVALLCRFVYHDHLSRKKIIALCFAFIGMGCFLLGGEGGSLLGYITAIASSITYAFYMVYLEKSGLAHMDSYKVSFYIGIFVTLETLLYHLLIPTIQFSLPMASYGYLIVLSIFSSFLGVVWLQKGIQYLGSTTASLFCLFEPITSLIVGILILQEPFSIYKMLGACLIFIALIQLVFADRKHPQLEEAKTQSVIKEDVPSLKSCKSK